MCGLIFALSERPVVDFVLRGHLNQKHRGPDGEGKYFEEVDGVYLGMAHERLAIVGLSEAGVQPMLSRSGRIRILFNGEIYNYRELALQYGLKDLRSGTDTEVAAELIERLGMEEACRNFNGMWAIIAHDRISNRFYVSRDRFGKKPLYHYCNSSGIYFASEMHSLLAVPDVQVKPDPVTASRFLSQSLQNLDERSWIVGVSMFPAASIGEIDGNAPASGIVGLRQFWSPSLQSPLTFHDEREAFEQLRTLVLDSIRLRLHADVSVGIALSGGLDSSIIAAQAREHTGANGDGIELFSAVNPESKEDESPHIDVMERFLRKDVRRFQLNPGQGPELLDLLKTCIRHSDGPVSSFSSLLFYKLMESSRSAGITVVLTGQGADEAFCGYRKYPILEIKRRLRSGDWYGALTMASGFLLNGTLVPEFNMAEAKRYLGSSNNSLLGDVAKGAFVQEALGGITSLGERQWADVSKYSVPYLCHYEDRMSMAWSREVRSPFLDYRVVEMGLRMDPQLKMSGGWTKYALRRAFERDLPASIAWRKDKKGFINPQDDWLKGNLKAVVLELMNRSDAFVYTYGLVDRERYLEKFDLYCSGRGSVWFRDVFAPFSLELWLHAANDIKAQFSKV